MFLSEKAVCHLAVADAKVFLAIWPFARAEQSVVKSHGETRVAWVAGDGRLYGRGLLKVDQLHPRSLFNTSDLYVYLPNADFAPSL